MTTPVPAMGYQLTILNKQGEGTEFQYFLLMDLLYSCCLSVSKSWIQIRTQTLQYSTVSVLCKAIYVNFSVLDCSIKFKLGMVIPDTVRYNFKGLAAL